MAQSPQGKRPGRKPAPLPLSSHILAGCKELGRAVLWYQGLVGPPATPPACPAVLPALVLYSAAARGCFSTFQRSKCFYLLPGVCCLVIQAPQRRVLQISISRHRAEGPSGKPGAVIFSGSSAGLSSVLQPPSDIFQTPPVCLALVAQR